MFPTRRGRIVNESDYQNPEIPRKPVAFYLRGRHGHGRVQAKYERERCAMRNLSAKLALICAVGLILTTDVASAANPSAEQALRLVPVQADVDFDRPSAAEAAKCKMIAKKIDGRVGWIVESPDGTIIRRFVDTNGDNVVDQWSYYKDGLEVYRDIDANHNGKADQYRWFHTGGGRWALDADEDGAIDDWKAISAEEVTAEIVAAIAARDADRFARLIITDKELGALGLGRQRAKTIAEKASRATAGFKTMSARQQALAKDAAWVQFSAGLPGVVPAGADQSTKDVRVYENVTAIAESGGRHCQIQVGALVQVGDCWRVIDSPKMAAEGQAEMAPEGIFFQASLATRGETEGAAMNGTPQKLLADLEALDTKAAQATTPSEQAKYTKKRADILQRIADASDSPEQRDMWIRQLADMLSAAVQSGTYDAGGKRLEALYEKLSQRPEDKNIAAYVKFRELTASYFLAMKAPKVDFAKVQSEWLDTLKKYIADYPDSPDAAEAMLQLAISEEFGGDDDAARNGTQRSSAISPKRPRPKRRPARRRGSTRSDDGYSSPAKARWAAPSIWPTIAARRC